MLFAHLAPRHFTLMLFLAISFLLTACSPNIEFDAETRVDEHGDQFGRLTWQISPDSSGSTTPVAAEITPDVGAVDLQGTVDVFPSETTVYTLRVQSQQNGGGNWTNSQSRTVHIGPMVNFSLFVDDNLRTCVQDTGMTHIAQFKTLLCTHRDIQSLVGIEQLTELTVATLDVNQISDFTPLGALQQLETLSISGNQLNHLAGFPAIQNLHTLAAFNNNLSDISPLLNNPQLQNLALGNNQFNEGSQFQPFSELRSLSLQKNQISDASSFAVLTQLRALDLNDNQLTTGVRDLRTLTSAQAVDLRENGQVLCTDYANLLLALGPVLLFDKCRLF